MNTLFLRIAFCSFMIACALMYGVGTAFAADSATKCVTATTEAMHAKATAQMEKDIAPYANATGTIGVIVKQYKEELEAGWAAMLEPYCGYSGIASAIHSYDKTVTRTRAAFLMNIKHPESAVIIKTTAVPIDAASSAVKAAASSPASTGSVKKKAATATASSVSFSGLHKGMRSASVTALQKKLASYLGLSEEENMTGYFGAKTQGNIIAFQLKKGVITSKNAPGAGLIGPKTSKALSSL